MTEEQHKPSLGGAMKYLGISLPLMFAAPILMTIGFKALAKDNNYLILIIGIILAIVAILLAAKGVIKVSNYLFQKDNGTS
ncbi:DUF6095 family protein [Flavobacteriaceae bacterium F08102]|nr:DUF6095 family protein [Flavobacteriaceae bacterium F08102]